MLKPGNLKPGERISHSVWFKRDEYQIIQNMALEKHRSISNMLRVLVLDELKHVAQSTNTEQHDHVFISQSDVKDDVKITSYKMHCKIYLDTLLRISELINSPSPNARFEASKIINQTLTYVKAFRIFDEYHNS